MRIKIRTLMENMEEFRRRYKLVERAFLGGDEKALAEFVALKKRRAEVDSESV